MRQSEWNRVTGDVKDTIVTRLDGINDLTGVVSGEAHLSMCGGGPTITVPVIVNDALARIVTADLSTWLPTASPGPWDLEWEMTFGDGSQLTWPSKGVDRVNVRNQGA